MKSYVLGGVMGVIGLLGLFVASGAQQGALQLHPGQSSQAVCSLPVVSNR